MDSPLDHNLHDEEAEQDDNAPAEIDGPTHPLLGDRTSPAKSH